MRMQLQEASKLLEESGWELVDGKLLHSSTKEPFEFEILLRSPAFERIVFPFKDNLEKLGKITLAQLDMIITKTEVLKEKLLNLVRLISSLKIHQKNGQLRMI